MLRDGRLRHIEGTRQLLDRATGAGEQSDDLPPGGMGDGLEYDVSGWHEAILHKNILMDKFSSSPSRLHHVERAVRCASPFEQEVAKLKYPALSANHEISIRISENIRCSISERPADRRAATTAIPGRLDGR